MHHHHDNARHHHHDHQLHLIKSSERNKITRATTEEQCEIEKSVNSSNFVCPAAIQYSTTLDAITRVRQQQWNVRIWKWGDSFCASQFKTCYGLLLPQRQPEPPPIFYFFLMEYIILRQVKQSDKNKMNDYALLSQELGKAQGKPAKKLPGWYVDAWSEDEIRGWRNDFLERQKRKPISLPTPFFRFLHFVEKMKLTTRQEDTV